MEAAGAAPQKVPEPAPAAAPQQAKRRVTYTSYEVNTFEATFEQSGETFCRGTAAWTCLIDARRCGGTQLEERSPTVG